MWCEETFFRGYIGSKAKNVIMKSRHKCEAEDSRKRWCEAIWLCTRTIVFGEGSNLLQHYPKRSGAKEKQTPGIMMAGIESPSPSHTHSTAQFDTASRAASKYPSLSDLRPHYPSRHQLHQESVVSARRSISRKFQSSRALQTRPSQP